MNSEKVVTDLSRRVPCYLHAGLPRSSRDGRGQGRSFVSTQSRFLQVGGGGSVVQGEECFMPWAAGLFQRPLFNPLFSDCSYSGRCLECRWGEKNTDTREKKSGGKCEETPRVLNKAGSRHTALAAKVKAESGKETNSEQPVT